jgi:hypothetical protein
MKSLRLLLLILCSSLFFLAPALTVAQAPAPKQVEDPKSQTVYVTRTGKKYHREGCRSLAQSKIPMTLKDAKAKGYEPCKVCRPPQ